MAFNQSSPIDPVSGGPQIEAKNLGIVQDQMYHEALAYKKCCVYSEWFTDQALKDMVNRAAQHHREHFNSLENYLNSHS